MLHVSLPIPDLLFGIRVCRHGIALVGDEDFFRQSEEGARVGN